MKKIILGVVFILLIGGIAAYLLLDRVDYKKVALVIPSSKMVSSPYYYKKDGDFFLADDLKAGLEKMGYSVEYRFREDYDKLALSDIGNVIYFKGYYDFQKLPFAAENDKRKRILYLYYLEGLNPNILNEVDFVVSSSQRAIYEIVIPTGQNNVGYVPQFTNPERFKLASKDETKREKLLFVGSNHTRRGRTSVNYAEELGLDVSVYGKFWEGYIPHAHLKGMYIDNDELYQYYGNADIILNDHREDMRYFGFVSNRIYDVTATGGFVLTDYLPEIEAMYGDSVATYKDIDEYKEKVEYYLEHPEIRQEMAKKAREITLNNFTNVKVAEEFQKILENIKK